MIDHLDFPYHFDGHGLTATVATPRHVRNLIEQLLFTSPGERVMRPDFGSGLLELVFEPNSATLCATTQMLVQGALQEYLSHLIAVQGVECDNEDSSLVVTVRFAMLADGSNHAASFTVPGSGA